MRHRDYHERSRVERTPSYGEVSAGIAVVLTEKALDDGYIVCIFAEGKLTRTGTLDRFHSGFEKIVKPEDLLEGAILNFYEGIKEKEVF